MSVFTDDNPITIVMADDHEVVRAGLKRLLSIDKAIKVLDQASNGLDAVDLVIYHKPHIALLDILMPVMNGIEAASKIRSEVPNTMIVMLTAFEDHKHLDSAINAGADGYLTKDISAKDLVASIHKVMNGERVFSNTILKLVNNRYIPNHTDENESVSITRREQQILNLVALGKTSAEIGEDLKISTRTVESHRYNLMGKLGIKNTAALVRYAVTHTP